MKTVVCKLFTVLKYSSPAIIFINLSSMEKLHWLTKYWLPSTLELDKQFYQLFYIDSHTRGKQSHLFHHQNLLKKDIRILKL